MHNPLRGPGRQQSLLLFAPVLWLLSCCSSTEAGGTERVRADLGLVELRTMAPAGADISWEARQPLDLSFRNYEGQSVFLFCAHKTGTYVIVSDVIDWDARKRDKTTWIVVVGNEPPPPPPPTPLTPPPPPPGTDLTVAVTMDGNGRWAELRGLPRIAGHREGINSVREMIALCWNSASMP